MSAIMMGIVVVKTIIMVLGGGITYVAFKAHRRTGEHSLKVLGLGFGIITLGAFLSGVADQFLRISLELGVLFNSMFVALGLAIIMYSLYIQT